MEVGTGAALTVVGLLLLCFGGYALVSGGVAIAKKFRISSLLIGLTIVAYGTSTPELAVSVASALVGETDLILGNVIGSNIANIGMVIGISAIAAPLLITKGRLIMDKNTIKIWIPIMLGVSALLVILTIIEKNNISREAGYLFIAILIGLSFFLIAGIKTTFMLVLAVVCLGLGRAMYNVPSRALISDMYIEKRGQAMGIFTAGSDLGGINAGILATILAMVYLVVVEGVPNWRVIMGVCGVVSFGLIGTFMWVNQEKYKWDRGVTKKIKSSVKKDLTYIVGEKDQRETILAFALFIFVATAMVNFLPLFH